MVETIKTSEIAEPLDIFVMAAVFRGGLNTLYAFQRAAGVEPGSISHIIRRLEKGGFLARSEGAKRGKRAMKLTEAGEKFLVEEWKKSMDAHREIESVLRSATVALLMGDIREASRFLSESIADRPPQQGHQELETISPQGTPINFHSAMRTFYLGQRRTMEIGVLERFADYLRRSIAT
jgi:DNA-binding MarR family transcriptional regulator